MSWILLEIKTFGMPNHLRGKPSVIVDIVPAGAGLDTVSSSGNMAFVGGSDNDTDITGRTDEFSAGREGSPRLSPLVTAVAAALIAVFS